MSSIKTQALLRRVAATSGPERSFWKGVGALAQEAGPNWGLDLHADRGPLAADAFVYLVDTSNFWIASAAIAPAQLVALKDEVDEDDSTELRSRAAVAMARASSGSSTSQAQPMAGSMASPATLQAFAAGLRAIAAAPGFVAASEQSPELDNHHWILLLYRLAEGGVIAGFGYVDEPIPGMLDRESLTQYVANMVEMDLGSDDTIVNGAVKQARGVVLAPALRHLEPGGL